MLRQGDASTGIDLVFGFFRRSLRAVFIVALLGAAAGLVVGGWFFWHHISPTQLSGFQKSGLFMEAVNSTKLAIVIASVLSIFLLLRSKIDNFIDFLKRVRTAVIISVAAGGYWLFQHATLHQVTHASLYPQALAAAELAWKVGLGSAAGIWLAFGLTWRAQRRWRHKRGSRKVSDRKLSRMLRWRFKASAIRIGRVPMLKGSETQHTLVVGAPGSGKSVMLKPLVRQVMDSPGRAIIFDPGGELYSFFARDEDHLLNPFDDRSERWTPWAEMPANMDSQYALAEAERIAGIMIPQVPGEKQPFFPNAARTVLANAILTSLDDRSLEQLREKLVMLDLEDLAKELAGTEAGQVLVVKGKGETAQSVRATLMPHVRVLRWLVGLESAHPDRQEFSIRDWIQHGSGNLYIGGRTDYAETLSPLWTLWLDTASAALLGLEPDLKRRIWVIADEAKDLGKMPSLPRLMSGGRRFGAAVVLVYQSIGQLISTYGKDESREIVNSARTRVVMAQADYEDAKWASDTLGSEEVQRSETSYSVSTSSYHGMNVSDKSEDRKLVMPEEITHLKPLRFYIQLPGKWPIAKTKASLKDVKSLKKATEPLVEIRSRPPEDPDEPKPPAPEKRETPVQKRQDMEIDPPPEDGNDRDQEESSPEPEPARKGNPLLPSRGLQMKRETKQHHEIENTEIIR